MKVDLKVLSIPPYISTSWKNIASLHIEALDAQPILIVTLLNGSRIHIPQLPGPLLEEIFSAHANYLEQEEKLKTAITPQTLLGEVGSIFPPKNPSLSIKDFNILLQHDITQGDHPDLPEEVLTRIQQLGKTLSQEELSALPTPEPHCHCPHCQIVNALQKNVTEELSSEEIVSDEDLHFKTWEITEIGQQLFHVVNPLDTNEHYNVYLGEPIGCTCGELHCEHVKAVLNS